MKLIFLISILSIILAVQAGDFKFYVFACEWAGSVCDTQNCDQDQGASADFWNIHGLWPSDGSETLAYCTDEKFDPSQLSSLTDELASYWNGLYSSADSFHAHEWTKHGTCSNMTQEVFFSTVMKLAQNLAVYNALNNAGITPGSSYQCSDIADAIKKEFSVNSFSVQEDGGYLSAIQLCLDGSLNLIDCPAGSSDDVCSGSVNYPDFSQSIITH